jgi:hypothetical protein
VGFSSFLAEKGGLLGGMGTPQKDGFSIPLQGIDMNAMFK